MEATGQPNESTFPNQERRSPPPVAAYTHTQQPFINSTYSTLPLLPNTYPHSFFAYPPPLDANHNEIGQNGVPVPAPYMTSFPLPPPMMYAFPPLQGQRPPGGPGPDPAPPALAKPKRKKVKMACTNCATACKRCDEGRPCERCQKYGIAASCQDKQRKERKKGDKRGPYKGGNKNVDDECTPAQAAAANLNAPILVAQTSSPEGHYELIYYPAPGTFSPRPDHEIPSGQERSVPDNSQPPVPPHILPANFPYLPSHGHTAVHPLQEYHQGLHSNSSHHSLQPPDPVPSSAFLPFRDQSREEHCAEEDVQNMISSSAFQILRELGTEWHCAEI